MLEAIHAQESKKAAREKAIKRSRNFPSGEIRDVLGETKPRPAKQDCSTAAGREQPPARDPIAPPTRQGLFSV